MPTACGGATPRPPLRLPSVPERDYYDILGVKRSASQDEIRSAYRKLARLYHPDVSKAPDAPKKFNEVQKAYDALGDEEKRRLYDQFGADAADRAGPQPHPAGGNRGPTRWSTRTGPGQVDFDIDGEDLGSVFEAIFGAGAPGAAGAGGRGGASGRPRGGAGGARGRRSHEEPDDTAYESRVDFVTAAKGGTASVRVHDGGGSRVVEARIPAGTEDGAQVRVRGAIKGEDGRTSDLLLRIRVLPHELWRRGEHIETGQGLDLYLDLPLNIAEATLGAAIDVPTLSGKVTLTVPPGTPSGKKLRMKGLGIVSDDGRKGDLVAIVQVVPPSAEHVSDLEKDVIRRVAASGGNPRSGPAWRRA